MGIPRVIFPFSGASFGGSHVSALALMRTLPDFGFLPMAVVHGEGLIERRLAELGLEYQRISLQHYQSGQGFLSALPMLARLLPATVRILKEIGADIIHINDSRMANTWISGARMAGCRIVLHQRTRFSQSRLLEWNVSRADAVVTISEYVRSTLSPALRKRAAVVFNPIDEFETESRGVARKILLAALDMPADGPIVGFVGTLSKQKRPEVFIRMAAKLQRQPSAAFLMFGRGDEREVQRLTQLAASLGVGRRLRIVGFHQNIANAMAACDVIVAPAVNEGFGRVPIEAALAGTPTVAAASGGHLESIVDEMTGILVNQDSPEAFANAVGSLLDDPARMVALVRAAQEFARARFSPERHAQSIADVYKGLL